MRKFLIAAALVAVAACGEKAAEAPMDSTAAAPAAAVDTTVKPDTMKKDSAAAPAAEAPAAKKP